MTTPLAPLTETVFLTYDSYGSGKPPLLLLHGFPLDHTIWNAQVQDLQTRCQIITPDLRGHGKSTAPDGVYSMDLIARDVLSLLDRIGVYKAIWVGHSMGGYAVMAAYRLAPERFAGIGFVASNHKADSEEGKAKRYETAEKVAQQGAVAAVNPKLFHPNASPDSPAAQEAKQIMLNTPPAGIIGTLHAMATRPDSTETLKSIRVPALVIGGAGDQLFKPEIPQEMARLIPGAKLVMAEKSGHMPMMEQPDLVTNELAWLMEAARPRL